MRNCELQFLRNWLTPTFNAARASHRLQPRGVRRRLGRRQAGDDSGVLYTGPIFGALNRIVARFPGGILVPGGI